MLLVTLVFFLLHQVKMCAVKKIKRPIGEMTVVKLVLCYRSCTIKVTKIDASTKPLGLMKVLNLWKTSCIVPAPQTGHPSALNDYRPVALTSHNMKTFETLVLQHLRTMLLALLDPLPFTYQPNIGAEDAAIFLTHKALSLLPLFHQQEPHAGSELELVPVRGWFN